MDPPACAREGRVQIKPPGPAPPISHNRRDRTSSIIWKAAKFSYCKVVLGFISEVTGSWDSAIRAATLQQHIKTGPRGKKESFGKHWLHIKEWFVFETREQFKINGIQSTCSSVSSRYLITSAEYLLHYIIKQREPEASCHQTYWWKRPIRNYDRAFYCVCGQTKWVNGHS